MLPHVVAFNAPTVPGLTEAICAVFGGTDPGQALYDFAGRNGAPSSLEKLGMPPELIEDAVQAILAKNPRNPRPIDRTSMAKLISACHQGARPVINDYA